VLANAFLASHVEYSEMTPAFYDAFMETREPAANWEMMKELALELIYAEWPIKPEYGSRIEEKSMQPIVLSVLERALDNVEVKPNNLPGFEKKDAKTKGQRKERKQGWDEPDGGIYDALRMLGLIEMKLEGGAGDGKVQVLFYFWYYFKELSKKLLSENRALKAYPCFLIDVRGKGIKLFGAIYESGRIRYALLAQAEFVQDQLDECAKFLSKLRRGFEALKSSWSDGAESLRFDEHSVLLPCDCVAKELTEELSEEPSEELRFTGHVQRDVFTCQ